MCSLPLLSSKCGGSLHRAALGDLHSHPKPPTDHFFGFRASIQTPFQRRELFAFFAGTREFSKRVDGECLDGNIALSFRSVKKSECDVHFRGVQASSSLFSGLFVLLFGFFARYGYHKVADLRQRSRFRAMWMFGNDESSVGVTFRVILLLSQEVALALNLLGVRVSFCTPWRVEGN